MISRVGALLFLAAACTPALAQVEGCVGSVPVANFRLLASQDGPGSPVWVPVRRLNNLPRGYLIRYQPGPLETGADPEDAGMALVLVPASGGSEVRVLQPGPATAVSEWIVPFDVGVVLFVFAPQGLDEKRLTNLVTQDQTLVAALADYAQQTAELEASLTALAEIESEGEDALLPSRASTPTEQALLALVRALNPAVSSFDPLGAGRRTGPTSLMGRGADMFFSNAGDFVPGGGILPSVKGWLMPDTEFRSVFGAGDPAGDMVLCAQRQARGRNKIAYVWAYSLTNQPAPPSVVSGGSDNVGDAPIGLRASVPLELNRLADWDLLARVYDWSLVPATDGYPVHVRARLMPASRELRFDLRSFAGPPGLYTIEGRWDWSAYRVTGSVRLHTLDDLDSATIAPESADRLITGAGLVPIDLTGANLRFIDRAWMHRPESAREIRVDLPGEVNGPPDRLRVEVDTTSLRPGPYLIALSRLDGARAELPALILPALPELAPEPQRVQIGDQEQRITLRGSGLDRIERLEAAGAAIELQAPDGSLQREAVVRLQPGAAAGSRLDLMAKVQDMTGLLRFPGVLQIAGSRPRIAEAVPSIPGGLSVQPQTGELPAGSFISFSLRVDPEDLRPAVTIQCSDAARTVAPLRLTLGEKRDNAQFTSPGPGQLFLSFDPGAAGQSGCDLTATVESAERGASDPLALGKVVRLPRIAGFTLSNQQATGGYTGALEGWDLETIERTGWDSAIGVSVSGLPRPMAGQGARQSLEIVMPWPSPTPKAPLYIWLRGETLGRATNVTQ